MLNQSNLPSFLKKTNIYEVNLRQYSKEGSIQAFIEHLPRLKDMGIEVLWMMPIYPIGILNRKGILGSYYSIKDFRDINPEFGSKQDFKALVETVHANGMKIIIDWVANHAAWDNNWTITNPEYFVREENGDFKSPYDWTDVIQIDHSNKEEQEAMLSAMQFWVKEFDIDGFRADLAHLTPLTFWVMARKALNEIKSGLIWLAETEEIDYYAAFDIVYAWKWMHATEDFFKDDQDVRSLTAFLEKQRNELPADALQLCFTSNHDENSWNGTEYEKYDGYAQALTVFSYTYPGAVPLIYSGQELPNFRRLKFFEKDEINWTNKIELHSFYKTLAAIHRKNCMEGEFKFIDLKKNILAYSYTRNENCMLVFLNLGREKLTAHLGDPWANKDYTDVFTGKTVSIAGNITVELAPGGFLVLENN